MPKGPSEARSRAFLKKHGWYFRNEDIPHDGEYSRKPFDFGFVIRGRGGALETKAAPSPHTRFPFAEIESHQRAALTQFSRRANAPAFLWLRMGLRKNSRIAPTRDWLVPWDVWQTIESAGQALGTKSLPYSTALARNPRLRKAGYGAVELLSAIEVADDLTVRPDHPFHQYFLGGTHDGLPG